jgi:hypothetical protein
MTIPCEIEIQGWIRMDLKARVYFAQKMVSWVSLCPWVKRRNRHCECHQAACGSESAATKCENVWRNLARIKTREI